MVSALRRSDQVYFEMVAQRETLACGYAYTNPDFADVPECNFVAEAIVEPQGGDPYEIVEAYYASRGLACHRWVPAAHQPPAPLEALLSPHGYGVRELVVYGYAPKVAPQPGAVLRILGARAMRRAYTQVVRQRAEPFGAAAGSLVDFQLERLNDPQYDAFVGLHGDEPVGIVALLQVGPVGRVCDLYVVPAARGRGFARALLAYALRAGLRWAMQMICARVPEENAAAAALLRRAEFEECGRIPVLVRQGFFEVGG